MAESETPRTHATRHSPKGEARRRKIVEAAMELYSQSSYQTASLADIAAAAGISQAGLLHHFPSKQDLLFAVLNQRDAESARVTGLDTREGADYLNAYLASVRRSDRNRMLYLLSGILSAESVPQTHPAHDYFVDFYARRIATMQREVEKTFDTARFPGGTTAESVARWIVALSDGLRYQMAYSTDFTDRALVILQFLESLRPYLLDDAPFVLDDEPE